MYFLLSLIIYRSLIKCTHPMITDEELVRSWEFPKAEIVG
jgi:hypothetical protein